MWRYPARAAIGVSGEVVGWRGKSMRSRSLLLSVGVISFASLLLISGAWSDDPQAGKTSVAEPPQQESVTRVSLEVARDRAKLLHEVYASTLDVIHQRYFHGDRAAVPARAMEDVFLEMQRQSSIEAHWIAATLRGMNIDHDPETPFEKLAAREISSGKSQVEEVSSGYYRRAMAIPLSGGCMHCHAGSVSQSTRKHFAGLVISIPIDASRTSADSQLP
jgi:hypothetical protein